MADVLTRLADRAQISELLSRFCSDIDDKKFNIEAAKATFTSDGRYVRPNGATAVGPEAIARDTARSFRRFRATQHITTDPIIDFEGETARLRANFTAMHLWAGEESDLELSKKVQLENTLMQNPIVMLLEKAPFPGILLGASPPDSMCKSSAGCSKP